MEYKRITEECFDNVIQHLRDSFFADEPLNKAAGLCSKGMVHRELEELSLATLADNMSIMAIDENDVIAGVQINGVLHSGDIESSLKKLELSDDENFKKIFRLLYTVNLKSNIFKHFNVDKAFDLRILSVDERFRGQGISKELVRRSEEMAKDCGFKVMKADATGVVSQKVFKSYGFKFLSEQCYEDYTDQFGNPLLKVEAPHTKMQLLYKLLD